jgi:hypothetical protein
MSAVIDPKENPKTRLVTDRVIVDVLPAVLEYTSLGGDWRLRVEPGKGKSVLITLEPIATGSLEYSSGANLDSLAAMLTAARDDVVSRGISWDGL